VSWDDRYRAGDYPTEPSAVVIDVASRLPPGRALDLACGAGRNARWLADRGWSVVAIDNADEALRLIEHPHIETRKLDLESIERLPFDDGSFDLVLVIRFTHLPLFAEARRVSRGIAIAQPCSEGRYAVSDLGAGWRRGPQNSFIHSKTE
jgi:SAM-dependent methyltransferase